MDFVSVKVSPDLTGHHGGKMDSKKLYVGGLPYSTSDTQLEELFSAHGTVESARIVIDRMTGRSKGFGFVEMSSTAEAEAARGNARTRERLRGECVICSRRQGSP